MKDIYISYDSPAGRNCTTPTPSFPESSAQICAPYNKTDYVPFLKRHLLLKVEPPIFAISRFKDENLAAALSAAALIYSEKVIFQSSVQPRYLTVCIDSLVISLGPRYGMQDRVFLFWVKLTTFVSLWAIIDRFTHRIRMPAGRFATSNVAFILLWTSECSEE